MSLQDVAFLPSELVSPPHSLNIVVEVKALGPPHVPKQWLGASKGMLPVMYFRSMKPFLYKSKMKEIIRLLTQMR